MKAVLFDFNGTLYDDTPFHRTAWYNYAKRRFGLELTKEDLRSKVLGRNNEAILKSLLGDVLTPEQVELYSIEKEAEYRSVARSKPENLRLIEGAEEMFACLTENRIPFALATASIMDNLQFFLNDLGLAKWFTMDRIVYDEGKLASKPDPAFYLEAARRLNVDIADCIIVEDTPSGIEAAIRAGAGRIIVMDRTTLPEKIQRYPQVHAVIHDFYGFERFLGD